jgi:hypothetical protein
MLSESFIIKCAVYFTGIVVSIGIAIKSFFLINIGIVPICILCVCWTYNSLKSHRLNLLKKKEVKELPKSN